ncbi:MAG: hypothetical protein WCJ40_01910 [Planctomycetota bacterium]|nr:hypothetical protein [Planctomycetota bacterium]
MAVFPVGLAFLILVPGPDTPTQPTAVQKSFRDNGLQRATSAPEASLKMAGHAPPLPKPGLPLAIDKSGTVYEPIIQAIYEEPLSASGEAQPSPQSPHRLTDLPALSPTPSASPAPSA